MRTFLILIAFEIFLIESVIAYKIESQNICYCISCSDCDEALNSNRCKIVKLNNDIVDFNDTCIKNPSNFIDKIFDCQHHKIKGKSVNQTYGIYLENKSSNMIKDCIIEGFDYGIYLSYSSNNIIVNNSVNENNWDGIYLLYSNKNKILRNSLSENGRNGIYISYSSDNEISYNIAEGNVVGINLGYSFDNKIINNTISNNKMDGIAMSFSEKNIVESNIAINNNIGIFIDASSNNKIKNNNIKSNAYAGIYLFHNSSYNEIFNNEVLESGEIGIAISNCYPRGYYCVEGCENNIVENNKILKNRFGIYSNESSSIFKRNIVCENSEFDFFSYNWTTSISKDNICDKLYELKDYKEMVCHKRCKEVESDVEKPSLFLLYLIVLGSMILSFLLIFWFFRKK